MIMDTFFQISIHLIKIVVAQVWEQALNNEYALIQSMCLMTHKYGITLHVHV